MERTLVVPGPWRTLTEVKRANKRMGQHWFSPDTVAYFGTTFPYGAEMVRGRYFVTGERSGFGPDAPYAYSVRAATDDGEVETVGDFCGHASAFSAWAAASRLAESQLPDSRWERLRRMLGDRCERSVTYPNSGLKRSLTITQDRGDLAVSIYGNTIVRAHPDGSVTVRTCGWWSPSTRDAFAEVVAPCSLNRPGLRNPERYRPWSYAFHLPGGAFYLTSETARDGDDLTATIPTEMFAATREEVAA